jgi:hypothetical protein
VIDRFVNKTIRLEQVWIEKDEGKIREKGNLFFSSLDFFSINKRVKKRREKKRLFFSFIACIRLNSSLFFSELSAVYHNIGLYFSVLQ